ncbi:MAG: hypothetical protein US62_C0003G0022 [Candidatus Woesebacteria bacterium GW2011_GWA1_37_8]|uniref:Uncharacterized protein n=2 Tax=Candidatus Woeseibacteriota TaxID=1752722 RepID=A0A0G0LIM1_9BACT|nr:MAG: hypothetical protein US39_C0010G0021 [Microgenomates group bacterium GW2011_GWC1_37_12b]KKQ46273.1 MAG: hypothetical protein US62_C0003G0022 [Candidatus Woesebacteria bacterium GW2011_GWA1_37_8]KKQ87765.1 MAG: hypothetical protein UT10_C0001G0006 [Candidatus Woesebacteria bacterium GW2011_GWB1_38_8b]
MESRLKFFDYQTVTLSLYFRLELTLRLVNGFGLGLIDIFSDIIFKESIFMSGVLIIKDEGEKTKQFHVKNPPKSYLERRQGLLLILFWFTALAGGLFILSSMTNNFTGLFKIFGFFK